jgi:hypothetical protein
MVPSFCHYQEEEEEEAIFRSRDIIHINDESHHDR